MFALDVCKMCKNIGLQPDKIALHIKELIDLTEKVPLDQTFRPYRKEQNNAGRIRRRA